MKRVSLWKDASNADKQNILSLLERDERASLLDCGCGDGEFTLRCAKEIGTTKIYGIDCNQEKLRESARMGIITFNSDLNYKFPLRTESIDIIVASRIIEHLYNVDCFVGEISRVLRHGGYAIVSTDNLSSWHNIFAIILGKQAFSQHISNKFHIGNSLSPHYGEKIKDPHTHMKIFAYEGLKEIFKLYGFEVEHTKGAGYCPFSGRIASILSSSDPRHSVFITIKVRKHNKKKA